MRGVSLGPVLNLRARAGGARVDPALLILCLGGVVLAPTGVRAQGRGADPTAAEGPLAGRPGGAQISSPAAHQVVTLTSSLPLNHSQIDHRTRAEGSFGAITGNDRNRTPALRGTLRLQGALTERLDGRLFVREQTGWYLQGRTFDRVRDVLLTQVVPVDVIGMHLQLSLTGTCVLPGSPRDAYCTYTPGLRVDPSSIDPDLLVPTRFIIDSRFGETVDAATLAAIRQPGWQRGVPGGRQIGLDLDFPNAGYLPSPARRAATRVTRREAVEVAPVVALSRVHQDLLSNDEAAVLVRTVRGLAVPAEQDWSRRDIGWQLLALLLPRLRSGLAAGPVNPNLRINNNLFLAANNARLPRDSLTLYQSGIARVGHARRPAPSGTPNGAPAGAPSLAAVPAGHFHALWLGLSPVIERVQTNRLRLQVVDARETINARFAQGGDTSGVPRFSGAAVIESLGGTLTELDLRTLDDPFLQLGLALSRQPADLIRTSRLIETTRYVPSLSLTGTRTSAEHVLRYYVGGLESEDAERFRVNAYLGADWTYNAVSGWRVHLGAIGYSRPSYDYFSEVNGRFGKIIPLPGQTRLTLSTAAAYTWDRPGDFGDFVLGYDASRLDLSAQVERGRLNLSLTQGIDRVLPESRAAFTTWGLGLRLGARTELSARYTPESEQTSYLLAQAGLTWRPTERYGHPALRLHWSRIRYRHGESSFGDALQSTEDVLMLALQVRFSAG